MNKILVIEDHQSTRKGLSSLLKQAGYTVDETDNGFEAESIVTSVPYDLILIDLILPQTNGLHLLKKIKEIFPSTEVIIMTGHETIESAILAMKLGAYDYLLKPIEPSKLLNSIHQAIERKIFLKTTSSAETTSTDHHNCLLGRSKQMIEIFKLLSRIADGDNPIIIIGEPGTGKKTLSQLIHKNSRWKTSPLISIDCAALPDNLSEDQAFFYLQEKLRDGQKSQPPKDKGCTLFLKNIDLASFPFQSSLLHLIKSLRPVHSSQEPGEGILKLISSTKKPIKRLIDEKLLREDLLFRINTIPIYLPPLRERKVDIPLLVQHFLSKYAISHSRSLSPEVLALFMRYQWPGNVRELINVIDYGILMADKGNITLEDLPGYLRETQPPLFHSVRENDLTLDELEKIYILKKLDAYGWDQKKTANQLGIGRTTLWRRLKQYGVVMPQSRRLEG